MGGQPSDPSADMPISETAEVLAKIRHSGASTGDDRRAPAPVGLRDEDDRHGLCDQGLVPQAGAAPCDPILGFRPRTKTHPLLPPQPSDRRIEPHTRPRGRSLIAEGLQQLVNNDPATNSRDDRTYVQRSPAISTPTTHPRGLADRTSRRSHKSADDRQDARYANASPALSAARGDTGTAPVGTGGCVRRGMSGAQDGPREEELVFTASSAGDPPRLLYPQPLTSTSPSWSHDSASPEPLSSTSDFPPNPHPDFTVNPFSPTNEVSIPQTRRPFLGPVLAFSPPGVALDAENLALESLISKRSPPIAVPPRKPPSPAPLTGRYHERFEIESYFPFEVESEQHSAQHRPAASCDQAWPAASPTTSACRQSPHTDVVEPQSLPKSTNAVSKSRPRRKAPLLISHKRRPSDNREITPLGRIHAQRISLQAMNRNERSPTQSQTPSPRTQSTLSPRRPPAQSSNQGDMSSSRKPAGSLQLPPLPRFHPAVYQSPNSSAVSSPTGARGYPGRPTPQSQIQRSGPQKQLYQYQRDLIASVTRTATMTPPASREVPKAPHLLPCGSPGPATPLALEDSSDYLTKGRLGEGQSRELVDQIIREERDRCAGMGSPHSSPAVSPAGGRG